MNKKKLVDVADEVMTEIDFEMEGHVREHFEQKLCLALKKVFSRATMCIEQGQLTASSENKMSYAMVKPVLDDCLDKILGERRQMKIE